MIKQNKIKINKGRQVGIIDNNPIYMFDKCNIYCVDEHTGKVYTLVNGIDLEESFFVYNEAVKFTQSENLNYNVILDKRRLFIEGHLHTRVYNKKDGTQADYLDGEQYEIFPLSGIDFNEEALRSDVSIRHFLSRVLPEYSYTNLDINVESHYVAKYRGTLGLCLGGDTIIEDELQSGDVGIKNIETSDKANIFSALRLIFHRRVLSKVDESSIVDIVKEDMALSFERMETELNKHLNTLNLSSFTKKLGLAKDTLYGLRRKINSGGNSASSKKKMSIYRISYSYLVSTNKSILK